MTGAPIARLQWSTGRLGCGSLFMAAGIAYFAAAAFHPGIIEDATSSSRFGAIAEMLAPISTGGVNIPFLGIALAMLWATARTGWRWADQIAAVAAPDGLHLHRSLGGKVIQWDEVEAVRFELVKQGLFSIGAPTIRVILNDSWSKGPFSGRSEKRLMPVDNDEGAAERFADAANAYISGGSLTAAMSRLG